MLDIFVNLIYSFDNDIINFSDNGYFNSGNYASSIYFLNGYYNLNLEGDSENMKNIDYNPITLSFGVKYSF